MARLLISVRDAGEARLAIAGGAGILDIKDPRQGPLGMAPVESMAEIAGLSPPGLPLGASLGEWADWRRRPGVFPEIPDRLSYLKVGLSGLGGGVEAARLRDELMAWRELDPNGPYRSRGPVWVAVLYADWEAAGGPGPEAVLELAESGFGALLVDTFDKRQGPDALFRWLGDDALREIIDGARSRGLEVVLAGSLSRDGVRRAAELHPTAVGVRSAACRNGDRHGDLDPAAVAELAALAGGGGR